MADSLKKQTVKGVKWSGIERFATIIVQFVVNILLARLLTPEDFGLIAEIMIFIQISQILIDSGFTSALIQYKDRNDKDYSTVYYFNIVLSIILYLILFFSAPIISSFFSETRLTPIIRIVSLSFLIGSLMAVHKTRLTILLKFKEQSYISIVAAVISGFVSVFMAYKGFGVWALVAQTILTYICQAALTIYISKWKPKSKFSKDSFKRLFKFSSRILGASLINQLYTTLYPIIIGKKYNSIDLGYYNRADYFSSLPPQTLGNIISRVAFPVFSKIQDNIPRLKAAYSKYIQFSSFIIFPIMTILIAIAKPAIILFLTEKWISCVPMFQILCLAWILDHISQINLNILYVSGRSDLALKLEIIKKIIAVSILFITMSFGIIAICWGRVIYSIIATILNTNYTKHIIGLSRLEQLRDFGPFLLIACITGLAVNLETLLFEANLLKILTGIIFGFCIYIVSIFLINKEFIIECKQLIKNYL